MVEFGTYQQVILIVSIIALISSFGQEKAMLFFTQAENCNKNTQVCSLLIVLGSSSFFILFVGLFWQSLANWFNNPDLIDYKYVSLALIFFRAFSGLIDSVFIVNNKGYWVGYYKVTYAALMLSLYIYLIHFDYSIIHFVYIQCLLAIFSVFLLIYSVVMFSNGKLQYELIFQHLKDNICFSFPLVLSMLTTIFAKRIDGVIVSYNFSPVEFAVYSRGAIEIPISALVIYNVANLMMPRFVELSRKRHYHQFITELQLEVRRMLAVIIPVFVTFFVIRNEFITILYGKEYIESVKIFEVYLFLLPIECYAFNTILQAMNCSRFVMVISFFTLILNIIVSLVFVRFFGVVGPAYATVLAAFMSVVLIVTVIYWKLGLACIDTRRFLIFVFKLTLSSIPVIILFDYSLSNVIFVDIKIKLPIIAILSFFSSFSLLWVTSVIEKKDKIRILSIFCTIFSKESDSSINKFTK